MPMIDVRFRSDALQVQTAATVILPHPATWPNANFPAGYPTLYLLHGLSDDHTIWLRHTSLERYTAALGLAVVMPRVDRSYYANMAYGPKYWTFISEELPRLAQQMFRLSSKREDNFVAGLSMGGYGAFKLAMNHPDRFAAAASLSGALDPLGLLKSMPDRSAEWTHIFGDPPKVQGTESDLYEQAQKVAAGPHSKMPFYQCCGTADFLYQDNLKYRDFAQGLGLNITYEEHDGRDHEWGYWDQQIQRVLQWLPLPAASLSPDATA